MLVTGKRTDNARLLEALEDIGDALKVIVEAIGNLKQEAPTINVEPAKVVIPKQEIVLPEQKAPVVNIKVPEPKRATALRCKITRDEFGRMDYFDLTQP
jgi:hypothetical protein